MLVDPSDRPIDVVEGPVALPCDIGSRLDDGKEAAPDARLLPAVTSAGHRLPRWTCPHETLLVRLSLLQQLPEVPWTGHEQSLGRCDVPRAFSEVVFPMGQR